MSGGSASGCGLVIAAERSGLVIAAEHEARGSGKDEKEGVAEQEEQQQEEAEDQIIPKPEPDDRVRVSATVGGARWPGSRYPRALLHLPDGRVLVSDAGSNLIRALSADLQQVSTVAGDGGQGYWGRDRDGAALQAQFRAPYGLALLPGGRGVLVVDGANHRIRALSADLQQVSTVAGDGERGHRDGAAAQAQFRHPTGLALLPDGRVLVADAGNNLIRALSADLQQVSTVAGDGEEEHRDGAAAQAQFNYPTGLALLTDGRVLVSDYWNNRIRALSADLQQVSTVAGDGERGHRDGAAAQAQFLHPIGLALLPDGRVLVADQNNNLIRVLSADLQQVSTLTNVAVGSSGAFLSLPDGRVLVGGGDGICVLEGFPAALLGPKPSFKRPKKTNQQLQKEKKRALAGGASSSSSGARSSGPVLKRSRSGASSSSAASMASSSDSEGEEQPGGSAAEAEPLV